MKKMNRISYLFVLLGLLLLIKSPTVQASQAYSSEWESYSSYYYYNQMTEAEQLLYDRLNTVCLTYLTGTDSLSNNQTAYCDYSGLTFEDAYKVAQLFRLSNPQYYFLSSGVSISYKGETGKVSLDIYSNFSDGTVRKSATTNMKTTIDSYVKQINKETSTLKKEKKIHDLIISHTTRDASNHYNKSAYSVLVDGASDCGGYSAAFSLLCNAVGINATVVTSDIHTWNYVLLNNSWYNVDCTLDDAEALYDASLLYTYFNRSNKMILASDKNSEHVPLAIWKDYLPTCALDSGATETSTGSISSAGTKGYAPVVSSSYTDEKTTITLSTISSNAKIYYTLDGTTPTAASAKSMLYTKPFTISKNATIKAVTVCESHYDSDVTSMNLIAKVKTAATPAISKAPVSKTYTFGAKSTALTVKASITDSGKLSYQWYKNTKNSTTGGTLIKGATSTSYTPDVSAAGTMYYYCIITNTNQYANTSTVKKTSSVAVIKVSPKSIADIHVSGIVDKVYTGKTQTQDIFIKLGSVTLKSGTDYTVSYANNKAIGKATVKITGKGNYTGSKSYYFVINPKKQTLGTLSVGSKKLKVTWKKDSSITGYELQYSTSKSFSSVKTVKIKKAGTTSYSLTKLTSDKKYYVRVRSYKTVSGKTYYGSWSSSKSATIK